jgi:hypothetical protein
MSSMLETPVGSNLNHAASTDAPPIASVVEPMEVLRQVLDLEREGKPTLDVQERMQYAVANPDREVVDSLGAVSVVCMLYGAYSPEKLIPANLLTHRNLTTLNGLRKVITELSKRQGNA